MNARSNSNCWSPPGRSRHTSARRRRAAGVLDVNRRGLLEFEVGGHRVEQLDPKLVIDECRRLHEGAVRATRAYLSVGARAAAKLDHGMYADMLGRLHDALFLDG